MVSDTPIFEGPDFGSVPDVDEAEEVEVDEAEVEVDATEFAGEPGSDDDSANRISGGIARSVLEHVARSIVDDPEAVVVREDAGRNGLRFDLHVAPGDMGRIIGKRGRVAQALRVLVRSAAARDGTDATVDIVD
ncbi:MAG TPA: KH domain-containing protein [Acidimicrobiales bacterium]|nr:KH domain-containing protein [Acidimicrobiales bacterium]